MTAYSFPPPAELAACPFPAYAELRRERPVYHAPGGEIVFSRHEDIHEIFRRDEDFLEPPRTQHPIRGLHEIDGEEHVARRKLLARTIAPGRLRRFESRVRAHADELVDGFADAERVEFVQAFALPFPVYVIGSLLGLDRRDADFFLNWGMTGNEGSALEYIDAERAARFGQGWDAVFNYAREVLQQRVDDPKDDLLTELLQAQERELGRVDVDALTADAGALIAGGMHTTASLIENVTATIAGDQDLQARARADRRLIPRIVEESLRMDAPVQWQPRVAARDTHVGDTPIPAGTKLILLIGAANRDDGAFGCPEGFDPARQDLRRHHSLGYGTHFCLGAPLARLEGIVALEALFDRFDRLELAPGEGSVVRKVHPEHRGLMELHLVLGRAVGTATTAA